MAFTLGKLTYIPIWKCSKCSFKYASLYILCFSVQMPVCCVRFWVSINTQDLDYRNWLNQTPPKRGNHYPWWDIELHTQCSLGHVHEGDFRPCLLRWKTTPAHGLGSWTALNGGSELSTHVISLRPACTVASCLVSAAKPSLTTLSESELELALSSSWFCQLSNQSHEKKNISPCYMRSVEDYKKLHAMFSYSLC